MVARWRYRAFAIALILVGVVLAVGTYPFKDPSPFGRLIKAAGPDSTAELALRSTNRIVPLVLLGLALLLGAGITALTARVRWAGSRPAAAVRGPDRRRPATPVGRRLGGHATSNVPRPSPPTSTTPPPT